MQSSRQRELLNEVLLEGAFLEGQIAMLEGTKRRKSMCDAHYLYFLYSREIYRSGQQQFLNANFVWNQDEVSQNSRYAKRFYYIRQLSAQTMQHLAVRVKPISFALRACFLGHYRMARMSQSASSCGLASWMRPHMIPDTHSLKLLFPTRYYLSLNLLLKKLHPNFKAPRFIFL